MAVERAALTGPGLMVWSAAVVLAIAAPWLNPVSWGPTPEMVQRLLSAGCAAVLVVALVGWAPRIDARTLANGVANAWLLAALLSAVLGLLQYFGAEGLLPAQWVNTATLGEAYANLRQRNQFASLTSLGLVALLYLIAVEAADHNHSRTRLRALAFVLALALLALGNAASSSRTGVLQWTGMVMLAWLWGRQKPGPLLRWSLLAFGLYVMAMLVLPVFLQAQSGSGGSNALARFQEHMGCESRPVLWRNVVELTAQHPWAGWGWGELKFAHFIYPYEGERFCAILDNAHNLPLHLAVTLGVPLALLLCGALLAVLWRAKPWREKEVARQLAWAGLAVIGIHSLLEYPLWYAPFQMAVALCLWLLWRTRATGTPKSYEPLAVRVTITGTLAACTLALVAYAGWDYWRVGQLYLPPSARDVALRDDTLDKVRGSWLFHDEVQFAYVTTTTPTPGNAAALYAASLQTLHFSPEPKVIATLLASAGLLDAPSTAAEHIRARWRVVYGAQSPASD
jgi:O-antigen ligase